MQCTRFTSVAQYDELLESANLLDLQFSECSFADFDCVNVNMLSCNRLYAVLSVSGPESSVEIVRTGERFAMTPGKVLFFGAGTRIRFAFHKGTQFFAFHFNLKLRAFQELFFSSERYGERQNKEFVRQLQELYESETDLLTAGCRLKALLFHEIAGFIPPDLPLLQQDQLRKYAPVLEYVNSHVSARLSIEEIADAAGQKADTMSRNFSRDMGMPLKKYVSKLLCARAEQMLRDRSLKISEIAQKLDFSDEYYFSHFFRRENGMPPGTFRQKLLNL